MDTIYLNDFKESFPNYIDIQDLIFDDINVIIYSNDRFIGDCYLNSILKHKFENINTITQLTYNNVPFEHNRQFSIFDILNISQQFNDLITYIDTLKNNKVLFDTKNIIIITNLDQLTKHQQHVLSVVIERQHTASFVCTTTSLSKLNERIKSRMLCKKVVITKKEQKRILETYAKDQGIDDNSLIKTILKECDSIYSSVLSLHTGICVNIIKTELMNIIGTIKKLKNIQTYISKVREVMYKLMIYNLSQEKILRTILSIVESKFMKNPKIMMYAIEKLSELDVNLIHSAKPIYHYELFFLQLYRFVNNKN